MPTDENDKLQLYIEIDGNLHELKSTNEDIKIISMDIASKSSMNFEGSFKFTHNYINEDELAIQLLSIGGLDFAKEHKINLKKLKDYLLAGGEIDSLRNINMNLNCYIDMFLLLNR